MANSAAFVMGNLVSPSRKVKDKEMVNHIHPPYHHSAFNWNNLTAFANNELLVEKNLCESLTDEAYSFDFCPTS